MMPIAFLAASYLLGAIPSSFIAGRLARGIDLREHGSGNLGATNTFRVLGARIAAPVMLFDVLKGYVPAAVFTAWDGSPAWGWTLAYGAAAILGHVFSVFMRFRGGKGVATATGVFLALSPLAVLVAFLVWVGVVWISRMVSLASVLASLCLLGTLLLTERRPAVLALGTVVALFVVYTHRSNLGRIFRGEEYRFGRRRRPPNGEEVG